MLVLLALLVDATTVRQVQAAIPRNVKIELDQRLIPAYRTGHLGIVVYSGAMGLPMSCMKPIAQQ